MTEKEVEVAYTPVDTNSSKNFAEQETNVEENKAAESPSSSVNGTEEIHNTSDDSIDNILKDVEEMRLNKECTSPSKMNKQDDSAVSTPDTTILSNHFKQDDSNITIDSPERVPQSKEEPRETSQALPVKEITKKTNIPNSVSQALFSQPLKVTKIREKSPTPKFIGIKQPADPAATKRFDELQRRDKELITKIHKLNKEIEYLKSLVETVSVTSDLSELRKLKYAIERLEEYLDKKQKEKYELGIQLTRAVRKRVDSGESGEFWVS